jgi:hypothetical protein
MHRTMRLVDSIEGAHQILHALVERGLGATCSRELEKVPIEASTLVPFTPLAEFGSHEKQLLTGVAILVRKKRSQSREPIRV